MAKTPRQENSRFMGDRERIERIERRFTLRLLVLVLAAMALLAVLALRASYLSLTRGAELARSADENVLRMEKIPCPRGAMTDRHGRILATSEPRFDLLVSRYGLKRTDIEHSLERIARLCPEARIPEVEEVFALRPRWKELRIARHLRLEQALPLMERQARLPGLRIEQTFLRVYPHGRDASQLTGYVGKIKRSQVEEYLANDYDLDDIVGVFGLEAVHEPMLRGQKGRSKVRRDARGRLLESEVLEKAVAGSRLTLSIDMDLQSTLTALLDGQAGSIVALDPRDGEVYGIASFPGYDANNPVTRRGSGDTQVFHATRQAISPGSTFKLITATAALLAGHDPEKEYYCSGRLEGIGGFHPACDARWGHEYLDLYEAITVSCNIYFYQLGLKMSLSQMLEMAAEYGFGTPTGIGLSERGDSAGVLGIGQSNPVLADRVYMAIGQGRMIASTPIQLAVAYAALANGGAVLSPTVVHSIEYPDGSVSTHRPIVRNRIGWKDWQRDILMQGFRNVVENTRRGTGRHANFDPAMKVAGKTGSAERWIGNERGVDAWFVCFSPWDDPEIVVVVLLEHAGHGGAVAAPVAKKVLEAYYALKREKPEAYPDKKAPIEEDPADALPEIELSKQEN